METLFAISGSRTESARRMDFRMTICGLMMGLLLIAFGSPLLAQDEERSDTGAESRLSASTIEAMGGKNSSLDPVVVSASRNRASVSETARSVTVIERSEIEEQQKVDPNLSSILAQKVPGISPSTQSISNFGQKLRGRNILVLIDGIPQSTPIRNGQRGLNTISPSAIERIEVIRGGTATYGFGATGGLINIITKESSGEPFAAYSKAGYRFDASDLSESDDFEIEQRFSGTKDNVDYVFSGSFVDRGARFDGDGDRVPPDPFGNQGGYAESDELSLLGKAGLNFDQGKQRLEFMATHFDNGQESDFVTTPKIEDDRTVAVPKDEAASGFLPVKEPGTENTAGRLSYEHRDLLGSEVRVDAYGLDQNVIFTGFQGNSAMNLQQQIGNEVRKHGVRATVNTPIDEVFPGGTELTWGLDYLHSDSERNGFGGDAIWVESPDLDQDATAGFAELEVPTGDIGTLRAGVRYETVDVGVDRLPGGVAPSGTPIAPVNAGSITFDEFLFNAGGVLYVTEKLDFITNFSQGFSLADLSRGLNGARFRNFPSVDPKTFESEAQTVDNLEMGLRYFGDRLTAESFVFFSRSDNTPVFEGVPLRQFKRDSETWGIEGQVDYTVNQRNEVGTTFAWSDGEQEQADGSTQSLPGTQIPPVKLTGYWSTDIKPWWRNRLQVTYVGNRNEFEDAAGPGTRLDFGKGRVDAYEVFDLVSTVEVGPGELGLSVRNLLDKEYKTAINQAANTPSNFANATGRRFGFSYEVNY